MGAQEIGTGEQYIDEESVERRTRLFKKYIEPHLDDIYKLVVRYSFERDKIDDNYNECLANFFRYIETYDQEKPLHTWIHIIVKRFLRNHEREIEQMKTTDNVDIDDIDQDVESSSSISYKNISIDNYRQHYSDDVLWALDCLKPIYRDALILQQAGFKLIEIVDICHDNGTLDSRNIDTIKSRLFLARQQLQKLLTKDGKRRESETGENPVHEDS